MSREFETDHNHIEVFPDRSSLYEAVAGIIADACAQAVRERGHFNIALAGGSSPRALYQRLSETPWRDRIEWEQVRFFFGDERAVHHNHAQSNYRMANETLFRPLGIDPEQQFPMPTGCTALQTCADSYAEQLRVLPVAEGKPVLDLCLLGMGDDGHTASLFPDTEVLDEHNKWVRAVYVKKLDSWRLTLTLPVINNAAKVLVLVTGDTKAQPLRKALYEPQDRLPVQLVQPAAGLWWYVDEAAAGALP